MATDLHRVSVRLLKLWQKAPVAAPGFETSVLRPLAVREMLGTAAR